MIQNERADGKFNVNCDECPEFLEVYTDDWQELMEEMKHLGWRIQKNVENEFIHLCPNCA